jgi:hypothetical protein
MATNEKIKSAQDTVSKAQTVLDAADKSLNAAEKATDAAAKSKSPLLALMLLLTIVGILYLVKKNQGD